jgi:phosphoglycolate phosphatase
MYQHVIWDWNGTLLDDVWLCVEVVNAQLSRRGLGGISAQRYQELFGFPLRDYCRRLGFDLERESYEAISDEFVALYERRRLECGLRQGALEALSAIQRAGLEQSLLSAYKEERLREMVNYFGLGGFFSAAVGLDDHYAQGKVERGKRRMEELGWREDEVILIGDTDYDLEVARQMGVDCLLVAGGYQSRQRLEAAGAQVVDGLAEVPGRLGVAPKQPEAVGDSGP